MTVSGTGGGVESGAGTNYGVYLNDTATITSACSLQVRVSSSLMTRQARVAP